MLRLDGSDCLFNREHHIRIAMILQSLDVELLNDNSCYFGGGTAIVLSHNEYRESLDIDFLVSDKKGYQTLRNLLNENGINAITRKNMELISVKGIRADQYGVRTMLLVDKTEIKFEIVLEGRIQLEKPQPKDCICGVTTLSSLDMACSKLLANSDRWHDNSVFSRDLIDLAMLDVSRATLKSAIEKAAEAYGESIERDLGKAIQNLANHHGRLEECMNALKIEGVPKALLWSRIRNLKPK